MALLCRNPECRSDNCQEVSNYFLCLSCKARNYGDGTYEIPGAPKSVSGNWADLQRAGQEAIGGS